MYLGEYKQNTAATLKIGPCVDSTDGVTFESTLTLSQSDIRLSKNGGNIAQKNESSSCTYDEVGCYDCPIDATDTNTLGRVDVIIGEAGMIPIRHFFKVITADEWDRKYATTGPVMDSAIKARGTTVSCTATGAVLASGEALPDDIAIGDIIALEVSAGNWVSSTITDSSLTGDTVTYDTMVPAPTGAVRYKIFVGARAGSSLSDIAAAVNDDAIARLDGLTSSGTTLVIDGVSYDITRDPTSGYITSITAA